MLHCLLYFGHGENRRHAFPPKSNNLLNRRLVSYFQAATNSLNRILQIGANIVLLL